MPTCRTCGTRLYDKDRQLCSACWSVTRSVLASQRAQAGVAVIAAARAAGHDPTATPQARAKKSATLVRTKAAEAAWTATGSAPAVTEAELHERVLPALAGVPLSAIQEATGLSNASCSRIRSRQLTPHPRHWDALDAVASMVAASE